MGIADRTETIEKGKQADFNLLEKNPLIDIKNTRTIRAVYTNNKFYDRKALDQLLSEAIVIGSVTESID